MVKKSLNPKLKKYIEDYKKNLSKHKIVWERIILFGSYAKGKQHDWSDIDLAIISKQFGKDIIGKRMLLSRLKLDIPITEKTYIESHPLSPKDLDNPYLTLSQEIKKQV